MLKIRFTVSISASGARSRVYERVVNMPKLRAEAPQAQIHFRP
jgi:hypothetical protein